MNATTSNPTQPHDDADERPASKRVLKAAIAAAGGVSRAGEALDLHPSAVYGWGLRGQIPAAWVKPLCDLGGNTITPIHMLEVLSSEAMAIREKRKVSGTSTEQLETPEE